ncbi:inositol monophosphatase family protein [soil metagenome]
MEVDGIYQHEHNTAIDVAREAGTILLEMQGNVLEVDFKGQTDLVTNADRASESLIADRLAATFPGDGLLGEESGYSQSAPTAERLWVVDPLDGTTNYTHGFPIYAVSIALAVDGVVEVGAVYAPPLDEMFSAVRGEGAWLNGKPIRSSSCDDLQNALLCSGFPYDVNERQRHFEHWRRFVLASRAVRRTGAAAYDLCCVACGRFDGYWERGPFAWDLAAGSLIVTQAGGVVSDYAMGDFDLFGNEILAAARGIHEEMSAVLLG